MVPFDREAVDRWTREIHIFTMFGRTKRGSATVALCDHCDHVAARGRKFLLSVYLTRSRLRRSGLLEGVAALLPLVSPVSQA